MSYGVNEKLNHINKLNDSVTELYEALMDESKQELVDAIDTTIEIVEEIKSKYVKNK